MTILLQGAGIQAVTSAPAGPQFSSAEIETVNASTLVVTFDQDVLASENDYASGVTIKVNGVSTSISGGIRQTNHAVVYYGIPVLWHGSGDTVTWEYNSAAGIIVAESGGAALGDVTAQSVMNNCEYAGILDLQADTLALNDGDPVSTWADESGQGHDFTQTGTARPTKQTVGGYKVVRFVDTDSQWMSGGNFADALNSFEVIYLGQIGAGPSLVPIICKINTALSDPGWIVYQSAGNEAYIQDQNTTYSYTLNVDHQYDNKLGTYEVLSKAEQHLYINGSDVNETHSDTGSILSISNAEPVRIGKTGNVAADGYGGGSWRSFMILSPIPNATNRAALETRLGARYGLTVP